MNTAKLAKQADVTVHAVRYYTDIGLLKPARNRKNGYYIYRRYDAVVLRFIKQAQSLGYSLKEIARILEEAEKGKSPCPLVRKIVEKKIVENRRKIKLLETLQRKMEKAQNDWRKMKDGVPNGDSVCRLIESIAE
jgi:MerR family transcriptional regulator, Zn(II)-responsive regulator of zntA